MRSLLAWGLAACVALFANAAHSEGAIGWAKRPDGAQAKGAWPAEAARQGIEGRGVVRCKAGADGALSDCRLISETPAGMGFGAAVLSLASSYLWQPTGDPAAAGREVSIVVDFENTGKTGGSYRKKPTPAEVLAAWPEKLPKTAFGKAIVDCRISAAGKLSECELVDETPVGAGVGSAALSLVPLYDVKSPTRDGKPVSTSDAFPIVFVMGPDGQPILDRDPDWAKRLRPEDILGVWPTAALKKGLAGKAAIKCKVSLQGGLFDCKVLSETPAGAGFGSAALLLVPQILMRPATIDGKPAVSDISIPITFQANGPVAADVIRPVVGAAIPWETAPTHADVVAAYPPKARAETVGGHVTLACSITNDARVTGCETLSEEPKGYGFAKAARSLAPKFKAPPIMKDGKPLRNVGIQLPVTFAIDMLADAKPVVGKPLWAATPSIAEFETAFPNPDGQARTVRVMMQCVVQQGGWLGECTIVSEEPKGMGFGDRTLGLAGKFRMVAWSTEGLPIVGSRLNVPIRYEMINEPPPPPGAKP